MKKRLVYIPKKDGLDIMYGGQEFDGHIPDKAILDFVHERGKTVWYYMGSPRLYLMDREKHKIIYEITVEPVHEEKVSWFKKILKLAR